MYVAYNDESVTFCTVTPIHPEYGKTYPILTMYNDGSWARQEGDTYYRSPTGRLRKPFIEYTLAELKGLLDTTQKNEISKEFAQHCYNDNLRLVADYVSNRIKEDPEFFLMRLGDIPGLEGIWKHHDKMKTCKKFMK